MRVSAHPRRNTISGHLAALQSIINVQKQQTCVLGVARLLVKDFDVYARNKEIFIMQKHLQ